MGCGSSKSLPVTPEDGASLGTSTRSPQHPVGGSIGALSPDLNSEPIGDGLGGGKIRVGGGGGGGGGDVPILAAKNEDGTSLEDMEGRRTASGGGRKGKVNGVTFSSSGKKKELKEVQSPRTLSGRREPLAFEVPVVPGGESLIKRHPPKKFQKLEEQIKDDANITPEQLEEKQAIAERRRKEILSQRIKSAKTTSARSAQARARAAESKEVDQLILSEEKEVGDYTSSSSSSTTQLPPLTNTRPHHPSRGNHDYADTSSARSRSTLSSANTTIYSSTPQTSAHLTRHHENLQKMYDEEYEELKRDRLANMEVV